MYLRSTYVKNTKKFSMKIIIQLGRYISSQIVAEFAYPPSKLTHAAWCLSSKNSIEFIVTAINS